MFNNEVKLSLKDFNELFHLLVTAVLIRIDVKRRNLTPYGIMSHVQKGRFIMINGLLYIFYSRQAKMIFAMRTFNVYNV